MIKLDNSRTFTVDESQITALLENAFRNAEPDLDLPNLSENQAIE